MISLTSPVRTRAHDWSAGIKLAGLCGATLILFFIGNLWAYVMIVPTVLALYAAPGQIFFRIGLKRLRVLWPFVALVLIWHAIEGSMAQGAVIILRMVTTVALANLVTMTTRLSDMLDVVHVLTRPLRALGLQTRSLEIAVALVIRMVPVLLGKGQALATAWRARSTKRPSWRIILPFALLALDDAEQISEALRARGGLTPREEE